MVVTGRGALPDPVEELGILGDGDLVAVDPELVHDIPIDRPNERPTGDVDERVPHPGIGVPPAGQGDGEGDERGDGGEEERHGGDSALPVLRL